MIVSACLVALLPLLAVSWNYGREVSPSTNPGFNALYGPPPPPPQFTRFFNSPSHHRQPAFAERNDWTRGKLKRVVQTVSAAPTTAAPSAGESPFYYRSYDSEIYLAATRDFYLEERVIVPSGTSLKWYKNNQRILRQGGTDAASTSGTTAAVGTSSSTSSSSSRLSISTSLFIDCASVADAGIYRLDVEIPSRPVLQRNYTIIIVNRATVSGGSCNLSEGNAINYVPRIYEYVRAATIASGDTVVLPCGFQGYYTYFAWYGNGTLVHDAPNHATQSNGNLIISNANGPSCSTYTCWVSSTQVPQYSDDESGLVCIQG